MSRRIRLAATALVFAAATTLPVITAAPAHADAEGCVNYLNAQDYSGDAVNEACAQGADGNIDSCLHILTEDAGVPVPTALRACLTAAN
ncbi:hypothetical protein ACTWP5_05065 [Streptomyces sp. 4N509B]|uniref:hypothetical protein n=1 Tax=Streptomyces sp. 4N509B TaxID=3457413 RepID=UPI003FD3FC10